MRSTLVVLILAAAVAAADTEIHRCRLEDGTIAFQETPCPQRTAEADNGSESAESRNESERPATDDDVFDFVNPFDQPAAGQPSTADPALPEPASQDRAECEKTTRDAIDAIDLEMRQTEYTREQGQQYLAALLTLTQQLRRCQQL